MLPDVAISHIAVNQTSPFLHKTKSCDSQMLFAIASPSKLEGIVTRYVNSTSSPFSIFQTMISSLKR